MNPDLSKDEYQILEALVRYELDFIIKFGKLSDRDAYAETLVRVRDKLERTLNAR